MKKELLTKLLLALVVVFAGIHLTACSDDEPQTQIYTYGWEDLHTTGSDLTYLGEMATAENAFKTALGSTSPITLNGTSSDCDAQIKAACEKAATSLKDQTWSFSARFEVTNTTTGTVVYSIQFTQGSKLF